MRNEYRAAIWVKIAFFLNSFVAGIGVWGFFQEPVNEVYFLIVMDIFCILYGLFFLIQAIAVIKWPVFITENNCVYYRGLFGCLYVYSNLERYRVDRGNQGMYLCDIQGKTHSLRTGLISRKKDDELYEYISRYCKPLKRA